MADTRTRFETWLMLYGSLLENWPEPEQAQGRALLLTDPSLHALIDEAQALESVLYNRASVPEASPQLAERIIAQAWQTPQKRRISLTGWLFEVLDDLLPRPSYALASVLAVGLFLGYVLGTSATPPARMTEISAVRDVLYGEGSLL